MIVRAADIAIDDVAYPDLKIRRDELRDAERCINGPKVGNVGRRGVVHGPVVKAGKCQRCIDVYLLSR